MATTAQVNAAQAHGKKPPKLDRMTDDTILITITATDDQDRADARNYVRTAAKRASWPDDALVHVLDMLGLTEPSP